MLYKGNFVEIREETMERNQTQRLPWAIVLFIVVLAILFAWGIARLMRNAADKTSFGSVREVVLNTPQDVQMVSDGCVYYDGATIAKLSIDGALEWSHMVGSGAKMQADAAGVAAWNGTSLTLINASTGSADFSGKMDAEILSARMGVNYAAVVLAPEQDSTIVIMESGGRRVDSITLSGQTVIDYGFFYNGTLFWVMTLDTSGTAPACTLSTYRPGRRIVGQITDSVQVIYHTMFQSTQIVTAGNVYLRTYDYNCRENTDRRKLVYGWMLADVDESADNPMMAFTPTAQYDGTSEMKDVRMIRGTSEQTVRMPFACEALVAKDNCVYGFSSDGHVMVARMGQQSVDAYNLNMRFDTVYGVADGNVAVLGSGSSVYFVSLNES